RHLARPVPPSPAAAGAVAVGLRLVGRARVSAGRRRGDLASARRPLSRHPGTDGGRRPLPRPQSQPAGRPRRQRSPGTGAAPCGRCDPRRPRRVSLCAARNAGRAGGLAGGLALAPARRRDPGGAHAAGTRLCGSALRQPVLPRHAPAPWCRTGARGTGRSPVASGVTAVSRLFGRTLLRPGSSLLVLGAAILASNWMWYGSGIFLG